MRIYIDERIFAAIGIVLFLAGFVMSVVSVGLAVAPLVQPVVVGAFLALIAMSVMVVLMLAFSDDLFFWIVWVVVVAFCAIPLYGWWALIILGGIVSAGIFVKISK